MSRGDLKQSVTVDLDGDLPNKSKLFEQALARMGKRGAQHLNGMARMSQVAGRGLDMIGNRYTALISGGAAAFAIKQVGDLSERYTRLGINANISDDKVQQLKQSVFDVAQSPDIRVDPTEILGAIEDIVEKTGDLEFAQNNIRNIGLAIQATGATGADVGALLAEFQKQGITAPGEVLKTIDAMNQQGKEGAFTLKDLASLGPRVVAAYNASGRSGTEAMKEMGAALQVIRQGTGSSEMAATAFEATLRTLGDPKKLEKLKELSGINVFDPEQLKKGKQQLKPINELMVEIVKASGGKQTNLAQVFDAEAMRAFNTAAAEFQRSGAVNSLDKFMQVSGDGTTTINDSARAAREFNASMTYLKTSWDDFANDNLAEPVQDLADYLNAADKETVQLALNTAKWIAYLVGGAIAVRKMYGAYQAISGLMKNGLGGAAGALGKAGGAPIPVFVVNNMPGGMPGAAGKAGALGRVASGASKGLAVGAAGAAGWEIGTAINDNLLTSAGPYGSKFGEAVGDYIGYKLNKLLADFGNEESKAAIAARQRAAGIEKQEASMKIEFVGNAPVRVRDMQSSGIALDVDAGMTMVMP